jgi:ankyrin repeat protein
VEAGTPRPSQHRRFSDYEILDDGREGGMGVVYRAHQISLNRIVALKMIRAGSFATPKEVLRFQREAQAAASMDHLNIVPIYEVGEEGGRHYFTMKFIDGESLAEVVSKHVREEPFGMDAHWSAGLIAKVARAVHHAHQRGLLHRDLKPGNILLDKLGEPHVTDFGLARQMDSRGELTVSGAIMGTVGFMSPEQAEGKNRELTTATDIFSLGAILYQLLTGRLPFEAKTPMASMRKVIEGELQRPGALVPRLSRDLETICLKCLEHRPDDRYPSALALAEDLERYVRDEPVSARAVGAPERAWRWCRRKPVLASLGIAVLALLLTVAIGSTVAAFNLSQSHERETRQRTLAQLKERQAQTVSDFLQELFRAANPAKGGGASYTVKQLLDSKESELDARFAGQPEILLTLHKIVGIAYQELQISEPAHRHLAAALELKRKMTPTNDLETAEILEQLGYASPKDLEQKHLAEAMDILLDLSGPHSPDYLRVKSYYAGSFFYTARQRPQSETLFAEAYRSILGITNLSASELYSKIERDLGRCGEMFRTGNVAGARAVVRSYAGPVLKFPMLSGEVPVTLTVFAKRERDLGHTNTVEPMLLEAMATATQVLKSDDTRRAHVCLEYADWLRRLDRHLEASNTLCTAWNILTNKLELRSEETLRSGLMLSDSLFFLGQTNEAAAILRRMVDSGATSTDLSESAVEYRCLRSLLQLTSEAYRPGALGPRPLLVAARDNYPEAVKILLKQGAIVEGADETGRSPLMWAAEANATDGLAVLLDAGARLTNTDQNGWTALHWAADAGASEVAALLLNHGADVRATSRDGLTPLHLAARRDQVEVVHLLLRRGAIPGDPGRCSSPPLHEAAASGSLRVAMLLLKSGASPGVTNAQGQTALHLAATSNHVALVRALLASGADRSASDNLGQTPLQIAEARQFVDVAAALREQAQGSK